MPSRAAGHAWNTMNLRRITPGRESSGYDDGNNVSLARLINFSL